MAKKSLDKIAADAVQKVLNEQADKGTDTAEALEEQSDGDSLRQIEELIESNQLNNAMVRINRRGPMESKPSYVDEIAATDFDFENIKKMYGGGEYTFTILNAEGKYVKSRKVKIDSRFKGELDRAPDPAPRAPETNGGQPTRRDDSTQSALLLRMFEKQSEDNKLFLQMMMGTVTAAFQGRAAAPAAADNTLSTIMPLLIAMMSDRPRGGGGGSSFGPKEFFETLREYRELIGANGEAEKPGVMDKLLEAAPGFLAGFASMRAGAPAPSAALPDPGREERIVNEEIQGVSRPGGPNGRPAAGPGPNGRRPGPMNPPPPPPVTDLGRIFELCVSAARRGGEVELYADLLIENIGEKEKPLILNVLTGPLWFEQLFAKTPDAEPLKPWLTKLRDFVLEALNDPNSDEEKLAGDEYGPRDDKPAGGGNPPGVLHPDDISGAPPGP